jgi:hypothetical protein
MRPASLRPLFDDNEIVITGRADGIVGRRLGHSGKGCDLLPGQVAMALRPVLLGDHRQDGDLAIGEVVGEMIRHPTGAGAAATAFARQSPVRSPLAAFRWEDGGSPW